MPNYDFPFNERIRTLLRLENLFLKVLYNIQKQDEFNHHSALTSVFQILDVIDRAELKTDILQELDRQKITMNSLRNNPAVSEKILCETIDDIETTANALRASTIKLGQTLRDNEWLMGIKQRAAFPGGVCEFDIPSYHYWLNLDHKRRKQDLETWLAPLMPIQSAIRIILHILRGSGLTTRLQAFNGAYQQMLGGVKPAQMLRLQLHEGIEYFPEVSANKYMINIRFHVLDCLGKPRPYESDVNFSLTLCNL